MKPKCVVGLGLPSDLIAALQERYEVMHWSEPFAMPDATLTSQMSALIFKNALLKRRNPRRTVGEAMEGSELLLVRRAAGWAAPPLS